MYEVHEEKFFGEKFFAPVEQLVARLTCDRKVPGSIPGGVTPQKNFDRGGFQFLLFWDP